MIASGCCANLRAIFRAHETRLPALQPTRSDRAQLQLVALRWSAHPRRSSTAARGKADVKRRPRNWSTAGPSH